MTTDKLPHVTARSPGNRLSRSMRLSGGFLLLLAGIPLVLLPVPGLGVPPILSGLKLLAPDFPWAKSLLGRLRAGSGQLQRRLAYLQGLRQAAHKGSWGFGRRRAKRPGDAPPKP